MNGAVRTGPPPDRCGIAIVGGGFAGLELLRRLETHGVHDAVVVEAGPAADLRHVNAAHAPEDALHLWLEPGRDGSFHRPWTALNPPHYGHGSGLRRRVGGRSLYWHGVILPIEPWALKPPFWPAALVADLTEGWNGGPPLYARITDELARWRGTNLCEDAVDLAGMTLRATPRAVRPDGPDRWFAYSPLDAWRDPRTGHLSRAPIAVFPDLEATAVIVEGGAARGVRLRTREGERTIAADRVVLAAGTVETGRLAIQARAAATTAHPPVLTGLCDHIVQGVFARFTGEQAARARNLLPGGSWWAPCAAARSNLFADIRDLPDGSLTLDLQLTGEQLPSPDNFVACRQEGPPPWPVAVRGAVGREERDVVAAQGAILRDAWGDLARRAGLESTCLVFADYDAPVVLNDVLIRPWPANTPVTWSSQLGTEDHEGGATPFGTALTDDAEFVDVPGLYAIGPTTFPRLGAANPALTIIALAERLAFTLARRTGAVR